MMGSFSRPAGAGDEVAPDIEHGAIERLGRASVTVIGDVTLERRVHGGFEGEPGGPLLLGPEEAEAGAGAAIVCALAALGVATAFVCVLGDDLPGAQLTALIGAQGNVEPWLLVDGAKATTTETVYLDGERAVLRTRRHDRRAMQPNLRERMLRIAGDAMTATSVTVLSDRGHGTLDAETIRALVAAARQVGRRVIADVAHGGDAAIGGCDMVVRFGGDGNELSGPVGAGVSVVFRPGAGLRVRDREGVEELALPGSADPAADYARAVAAIAASVATGSGARDAVRIAAALIRRAAPP